MCPTNFFNFLEVKIAYSVRIVEYNIKNLLPLYDQNYKPNLNMLRNILIILSLIVSTVMQSSANGVVRVGANLSIENGLAHNGVSCAMRDSRGYLWIGTYDGLNRYGGEDITIYKNRVGTQLLQNNRILSIAEDRQNRLWVGTESGVTLFDYMQNSFVQLEGADGKEHLAIHRVFISADGERIVCVASSDYILTYNMDGELLRCDKLPAQSTILDGVHLKDNLYILASRKGLLSFDAKSGEVKPILNASQPLISITKYDDKAILVSYDRGMRYIEIKNVRDEYEAINMSDKIYKERQFTSMTMGDNGTLWLGCANSGGVLKVDNYTPKRATEPQRVMLQSRISNIMLQRDQIWVSTFDDGIFQLLTNKSDFNSFGDDLIRMPHITPFDEERVVINNASYVTIYNTSTSQEESLPFEMSPKLKEQYKIFTKDNLGRVWIVSMDSKRNAEIYRVKDRQIKKLESAELLKITLNKSYKNSPLEVVCDYNNNLWVAYRDDLLRIMFDSKGEISSVESVCDNKTIKRVSELSRPRVIYLDSSTNSMWVGTNRRGLFKIDLHSQQSKSVAELKIENFAHDTEDDSSISENFISAIVRASSGTLWIGTEQGGLCKAIENDDTIIKFETFSEEDGLSNNVVKSIVEDSRGNLWIGTNIGLNCYNTTSRTFTTYRTSEGLPFEGFWYQALSLNDEKLVFAGINKILTFNPEVFYIKRSSSKLYFDELKIFDTEVTPNKRYKGYDILNSRLQSGDTLKLRYNQNVFSIGVDLIEEQYTQNNTIYYRLSPVSDTWIKLPKNNPSISFNGVEPGRYKLEVCAYNNEGSRGEVSTLNIFIPHPAWKSPIAYLLYMIIFILIVVVVVYVIMSFQSLSHNLEIQTIEKGVNDDKLRYFSDISHELKTPLSLILAPVALLRERFSADSVVSAKLDIIKRQSKKLLELIELTHGVEANDLKTLKLSPSLFSFDSMIDDITIDFGFIAQYDNKSFKVERGESIIAAEADRGMIEKIINNLLSNALKHTANGNDITLSYTANGDTITLSVEDCGYGIDAEDLPHIFERFYQARRSGGHNIGGTGIGLTFTKMLVELHGGAITVESEFSVGTTFTVTLPIVVDKPLPEEVKSPALSGEIIDYDDNSEIYIESEYSESTIFLVEDNQELRVLICEIISKYFKVKSFSNGVELIEALNNEWPDLIVSDVMMPEMDGYEVCDRVKSDIKTSHIPIILLTACSTVDDKIKGLQLGADSYIPKPFYPKHLITRIETLLHNRQQLRERFQVGIPLVYGKDQNTSAKDNEFMLQLYELFNENLSNEDVDLDMIARELGQNRSMFFKKVKVITNTSPYELLKEYRLKKAAEMLQSGEYNVSEVCMMTGFKGRSHFSRVFKERYNVAPSKYVNSDGNNPVVE